MAKEDKAKEEINIIRIAGRDINGRFTIGAALKEIKGVGNNLAHALALGVEQQLKITRSTQIGSLTDEQIDQIEELVKNPVKANVPLYMINRRKDFDTGGDVHLVGTDLIVKTKQDIDNDMRMQNWRGFRHKYGQKVRGQRTKSTGRTGASVGVMKKAAKAQAAAAGKPATEPAKK